MQKSSKKNTFIYPVQKEYEHTSTWPFLLNSIRRRKKTKPLKQTTQHGRVVSAQEESMNQEKHFIDYHLFNRNIQFIYCKRKLVKEMLQIKSLGNSAFVF